ncbi:MAG: DUF3179 domain-containing protein [Candidatus Aminicenantes bacterium]|nr:MAG: DUF3179 domain-containing protein [Candidatus Aminicenantes bacterium]
MFRTKYLKLLLIVMLVFLPFCDEEAVETIPSNEWLIPKDQIRDGGPGKDGIPSIDNPKFIPIKDAPTLNIDLVIGIKIGSFVRAFPHPILDQHEIVNHTINSTSFALTYCPLTGSGIAWDTSAFSLNKTVGVSGQLYNSNLIPYDRGTDSNWSQMMNMCVNGQLIGQEAKQIHVVETTWGTWKMMYPDSLVLSRDTGFNRNYDVYPYDDYKFSDRLIFPVSNEDNRLSKKARIHGVIVGEETKAYPIGSFSPVITVLNEDFNGLEFVIVGDSLKNFAVSFKRKLSDGTLLEFEPVENELPVIMKDKGGSKWDIFGNAVSGPRVGAKLEPTNSFISYWFAWAAFYPGAEIYSGGLGTGLIHTLSADFLEPIRSDSDLLPYHEIKKKELDRFQISEMLTQKWPEIVTNTEIAPHIVDGQIQGFEIRNRTPLSPLSRLGILDGDIITEVNSIKLKDVYSLFQAFQIVQKKGKFIIGLERNRRLIRLLYTLE